MKRRALLIAALVAASLGCGRVPARDDKAAPPISGVVSGAGHMEGGRFTLDVQVGNAVAQGQASGGHTTIEGAAPVKP